MGQSTVVRLTGALAAQPATGSLYSSSLNELLDVTFCATYGGVKGNVPTLTAPNNTPFSIPFEGITKGRVFALRLLSGVSVQVTITTAAGSAVLPVSDELLIHNPNPGDEITAITIGTANAQVQIAYALAGDVT